VQANDDARELGIEVVDVRVMRLDLPDRVTDSIYDRMRSERQEVIRTLRAQGDAAANEIRADAEREETIILADAYRRAQVIKGEGDAGAARIYADAYGKDTAFYSFYRSLELYRDTLGGNDILILEPEGELFEYFNPPARR
jgi:membrane protease subunit HflC